MPVFLLASLTMTAFAANSLLNRLAFAGDGAIGPAGFALIRLASGAVMLVLLVALRNRRGLTGVFALKQGWVEPLTLALYMIGFSFAYLSLAAGTGALILFGGVQITMFAGALISREAIPLPRWLGAGIAFGGLVWLFLPGAAGGAPDPLGGALMTAAALGWGIYSLAGRRVRDPLSATARAFVLAVPLALGVYLLHPDAIRPRGLVLAGLSGAVTSGLGYALWYALIPRLGAARAAVSQLAAPVIAVIGGAVLLGEPIGLRLVLASLLVLGGVAVSQLSKS